MESPPIHPIPYLRAKWLCLACQSCGAFIIDPEDDAEAVKAKMVRGHLEEPTSCEVRVREIVVVIDC